MRSRVAPAQAAGIVKAPRYAWSSSERS
ncbi:MAG: hypothetical protein RL685_4932, partial [Pseudomonadota bacterium]